MEGYELFCGIAFGTSFDPKQKRKRINKLKNAKRNKRMRLEELQKEETDVKVENLPTLKSPESSDDSDDDSQLDPEDKPAKKHKEKKILSSMHLLKIRQEEIAHFRRIHKIYLSGEDVPAPIENFNQLVTEYEVDSVLLDNINKLSYAVPTPIQMQAIPLMLNNRQILVCAPTGSGKTAAFLVPLIHNLKAPKKGGIRAVVLAPTRELAKQIHTFCVKLSEGIGLRSLFIENVNDVKNRPKFLKKHDILISTPNRLIYMLKEDPPIISLVKVQWLIIDECDKLFEPGKSVTGFRDQLATIYNACDSAELKRAMFSATYSHDVEEWLKLNLDSLVCVSIGTRNTAVETVKQELLFTGSEGGKIVAIKSFLTQGFQPPVLIFVQSKERAKELYSEVSLFCSRVEVMSAELTQEQRDAVVDNFTNGTVWVLICTELMARGIDFKGVNLVINYDFPPTAVDYIHRIGRTGRAGEKGRAITYFTTDDVKFLKSIAQVIKNAGCEVPEYIMKMKTKRKKKGEIVKQIKRVNISKALLCDDVAGKKEKKKKRNYSKQAKEKNESSNSTKDSKGEQVKSKKKGDLKQAKNGATIPPAEKKKKSSGKSTKNMNGATIPPAEKKRKKKDLKQAKNENSATIPPAEKKRKSVDSAKKDSKKRKTTDQ